MTLPLALPGGGPGDAPPLRPWTLDPFRRRRGTRTRAELLRPAYMLLLLLLVLLACPPCVYPYLPRGPAAAPIHALRRFRTPAEYSHAYIHIPYTVPRGRAPRLDVRPGWGGTCRYVVASVWTLCLIASIVGV